MAIFTRAHVIRPEEIEGLFIVGLQREKATLFSYREAISWTGLFFFSRPTIYYPKENKEMTRTLMAYR